MYCSHCGIHFSGGQDSATAGEPIACPYCGRLATDSGEAEGGGAGPEGLPEADLRGSRSARIWRRGRRARAAAGSSAKAIATPDLARRPDREAETAAEGFDSTRTDSPAEWAPGTIVAGKYEVVSRLGAGGFGTVYKVRHLFRQKYYALKTPHPEFVKDTTFRVRFEREIEAMERFVHPDAVMIRDSGLTERGTPYYTMDFIDGESLKVVLRREKRISVERALAVIRRVLRVLDVAHAHRIIHRDIKPDNILVTTVSGRETVKVLDFGVAKLLDLVGETGSVTKGGRVGTPKYMSPEQILGEPLDQRSDLFSLGIVFYELVTGVHPYARVNDPIRVTAAILNRDARPPGEIVPGLPRPVEDHIRWMLQKKPERRPESAAVLIQQLGALEGGVSRVAPIESLTLREEIDRTAGVPLVLRWQTSAGERRAFLIFNDIVSFGRTSDRERGVENDLLLRCLPCRSKTRDVANWESNLTISQHQGTIRPDGTTVLIEPAPQSRAGIRISGVRCTAPIPIHTDRFHLALGDRALELDGHRRLRGPGEPYWDLAFLKSERPSSAITRASVGYSSDTCLIDHVHLARANNFPLHDYYLVWRQLEIGSSANTGLRLPVDGVEAVHAAVLFEGGEAFLLALGGKIGLEGTLLGDREGQDGERSGSRRNDAKDRELELLPHELIPLRPGLELRIGGARITVDRAEKHYFKNV